MAAKKQDGERVTFRAPGSPVEVTAPAHLAPRYEGRGWTRVEETPKEAPKRRRRTRGEDDKDTSGSDGGDA